MGQTIPTMLYCPPPTGTKWRIFRSDFIDGKYVMKTCCGHGLQLGRLNC